MTVQSGQTWHQKDADQYWVDIIAVRGNRAWVETQSGDQRVHDLRFITDNYVRKPVEQRRWAVALNFHSERQPVVTAGDTYGEDPGVTYLGSFVQYTDGTYAYKEGE